MSWKIEPYYDQGYKIIDNEGKTQGVYRYPSEVARDLARALEELETLKLQMSQRSES